MIKGVLTFEERIEYMINTVIRDHRFILLLFLINLFGTIYGFLWYEPQLAITPPIFLIFVPDSPMASLFFTIFLLFLLFGKNTPYIEALAFMTLIKYGVWAVVMNLLTLQIEGYLPWEGYMLIVSHALMAVQAFIYLPLYQVKLRHLMVAAIWILHNDIIDYVFGMMPIYSSLTYYMNEIGYFTFWLSISVIFVSFYLTKNNKKLNSR